MRKATIALACGLALAGGAFAQTSGTVTTAAGTTVSSSSGATGAYLKRADTRFGTFTGSSANTESLATGLRTGSEVTLTGGGETATFTPPTKPMGYGEITRSLDLAQRQLAAAGISDPTPSEIQAALMGGTVTGPNGDVTLQGVLQLRSEGMGWGQIAHTIGVHPGLGKTAATQSVPANGAAASGVSTAGAKSGIVTATGGSPVTHGNGRALGLTTGGGASAAAGASNAGGLGGTKGQGNAFGHSGK
jgi:hypothetical protein